MNEQAEDLFYDLENHAEAEAYRLAFEERATIWAKNFEVGGGGDGEPYTADQADDLAIEVLERWPEDFGNEVVGDPDKAWIIGLAVSERVIAALTVKRAKYED